MLFILLTGAACFSNPPEEPPSPYSSQSVIPNSEQILAASPAPNDLWSSAEIDILRNLWLGSLPPLPSTPSNGVANNPQAAALGHRLFFDIRLSANNQIACATCHIPEFLFTDRQQVAHGTRPNQRHTMPLLGAAYNQWFLWDGHKDSLWAQAIEPIEAPDEQGSTRLHALHLIGKDEAYRTAYESIFGSLPDLSDFKRFPDSGGPVGHPLYQAAWEGMTPADQEIVTQIFANLGKAIAAYERLLQPGPGRFDRYVQALLEGDSTTMGQTLSAEEIGGLRLFIGRANCIQCHRGPLFSDQMFHNTGAPQGAAEILDQGRKVGVEKVVNDEFNCLSVYSEASEGDCQFLQAVRLDDDKQVYAFRTPTLRNVADTGPYMHAGQFATLEEILSHYNQAPSAPAGVTEIKPLNLSKTELVHLEAFLKTLSGPPATSPELLQPPQKTE